MFDKAEYVHLLGLIRTRLRRFEEAQHLDDFIVLRHDVEFSVEHARRMAQWEFDNHVRSAYFFQVSSDAYNCLSVVNQNQIREILGMGHEIGLHCYIKPYTEWSSLHKEMLWQKEILASVVGQDIRLMSFHRPPVQLLQEAADEMAGMLNTYGKSFFEFSTQPSKARSVKYCADSRRQWDYGYPVEFLNAFRKMQLLIHPDYWSDVSMKTHEQGMDLCQAHQTKFVDVLRRETRQFAEFQPF